MTVEKGRDWGEVGPAPPDTVFVRSDAEARDVIETSRRGDGPPPVLGLLGGDLCRTLGGRGGEARVREAASRATVDLGVALLDGRRHLFVAHLVARGSWWRGRVVAVMNAQFLGRWDVAPRAHPGDGRLDVLDGDLGLGDRWKARRRLVAGTHVPHPGIAQLRTAAWTVELERATPVWLDGGRMTEARTLAIRLEPDAVRVVV
ncbi:hypothetical protein [Iamia sp.]|uniref:hypothetical protein n=1 Tax=Iamia sp. TaxID=2722710 RepID=UPI002C860548|nr:hypothetical protein [Iamia sp.]HXH57242.1 hypothetical protein [Iamia sp.]